MFEFVDRSVREKFVLIGPMSAGRTFPAGSVSFSAVEVEHLQYYLT